jgi:hypothetical protein
MLRDQAPCGTHPGQGPDRHDGAADTAGLVDARHRRIQLSAINSGATLYPNASERGTRTFQAIEDYPFAERLRSRTIKAAVVELAMSGGVRDIADHIVDVYQAPA